METGMEEVSEAIEGACMEAGNRTIAAIPLEKPQPQLLDIRDGDFSEHVAMQPAAVAYYGVLKKQASRHLDGMKRSYDRWQKKKFQEAKASLEASSEKKPTIETIKSFILINNEKEIEKWDSDIDALQEQSDTMDVWYDAWRQKSFSLREHGLTLSDERRGQPYMMDTEETGAAPAAPAIPPKTRRFDAQSSISRVRALQQRKKAEKGGKA